MTPRRVAWLVAATGFVFGQGLAFAQSRDPAAGEALFLEGRRAMKAGDKVGACAKFAESQRLDPAVGTLANLADCEEQVGRTASAWQHWRRAADEMPAGDPRRLTATARAAALEKRLARLTIKLAPGAPATTMVARNGVPLGAATFGLPLPTDPGAHRVAVSAPGFGERRYDVVLAPEEKWELVVEPGPPLPATAVEPPPLTTAGLFPAKALLPGAPATSVEGELAPATSAWRRPLAYGLLSTGAVSLGAGGYFAWRAARARNSARDRCATTANGDAPACWSTAAGALDRDRRFSLLADVAFASGAVAAGAGVFFLLRGQQPRRSQRLEVLAAPLSGGGEVQLAGRF
jgi:hypothetical protein